VIEAKVEAQGKDNTKVKMKAKDKDNGKDVVVGVVQDGDLRQS